MTYWKSDTNALFWPFERRKFKSQAKYIAEVDAAGDVYALPGCAEGILYYPYAHFWVTCILTGAGINSVRSIGRASYGLKGGRAGGDTPFFVCGH